MFRLAGWREEGKIWENKMHQISKIRSYAVSGIHKRWELASSCTYGMEISGKQLLLSCAASQAMDFVPVAQPDMDKDPPCRTQLDDGVRGQQREDNIVQESHP